MNLEIIKYRADNEKELIGSSSANWLSEFTNQSTLKSFSEKHGLPEVGRILFKEIDYQNLSGVRKPILCKADDCLVYLDALRNLYKSEQFNYTKVFNVESGEPLTDTRVFIQGKIVNLTLEFYHGFTLEKFYQLKRLNYDIENLVIHKVIDRYDGGEHKIEKGEKIDIELREMNHYEENRKEIDSTIEFVKIAAKEGNQIQLMSK